ncbi:hypothetical protein D3C86_896550 [compost metagenome]
MNYLDAVLQGLRASATEVVDGDGCGACERSAVDHQFIARRTVIPQRALHPQLSAITCVIALHRQRVAGIAATQIDDPGVVQGGALAGGKRRDTALGGCQDAAAVDIEYAGAAGAVTENEVTGEIELRTVVQVDRFPIDVAPGPCSCGAVEGQHIDAGAAVEAGCLGECALAEIAQDCNVIAVFQQDLRTDDAAAIPDKGVVAGTGADLANDLAAGHRDAVVAAADADVAADPAPGNDDGVGAETGDQVAEDLPAGQVEQVVVEFHVDPADGASGHRGGVAVLEGANDRAAGHEEEVTIVALGQGPDGAATHGEGVNAIALVDGPGDLAVADVEDIGAIPLIHDAHDTTRIHVDRVSAGTERHVAIDRSGAVGGEVEGVVARQIGQRTAACAVASKGVVAGGRGKGAGRLGGRGPADTKPEGKSTGAVAVLGQICRKSHARLRVGGGD